MEQTKINSPIYCSIDPVVFSIIEDKLHVLLFQRPKEPYKDSWALPGGLINPALDTQLEESLSRVLKDKTGAEVNYVEQLASFGGYRDTRGWTLSVAYIALVAKQEVNPRSKWIPVDKLGEYHLAFDHYDIIETGIKRLSNKVNYSTLPMHFLGEKFTLPQLQKVYEVLLGENLDKSTFRKKISESGQLKELVGEMTTGSAFRPAKYYTVAKNSVTTFDKNILK